MIDSGTRKARAVLRAALALTLPLAALFAAAGPWANDQIPGAPQRRPVLLRGGDLYTVANGVLPATDLLFADGRIVEIGESLQAPADAEVIEAAGKRVYPGLIAPATTLGLIEIGAVRATNDRSEVGSITPEVAAHVAYNPDSELIPSVRVHGITTAQVVPGGGLLRGRSFLTHLDGWTKEDAAVRLVDGMQLSWPAPVTRTGWWIGRTRAEQVEEREKARRELRRAFEQATAYRAARRADPGQEIDLRWEAMLPVLDGEMPLFISADDARQIEEALEFGRELGLSIVIVGGQEAYRVVDTLAERRVPVILGGATGLPLREDDDYDIAFKQPRLLHEAGVTFALGYVTWGAWDVRNLPLQAGQAVGYGLPADVALRAMTLTTAEILGIAATEGSLEVGKNATLFISDGDVMDTLGQRISAMYIEGRRVDLGNRHRTLYEKYRRKPAPVPDAP
jgi:imidazolonepropionase-like amidohydrolase